MPLLMLISSVSIPYTTLFRFLKYLYKYNKKGSILFFIITILYFISEHNFLHAIYLNDPIVSPFTRNFCRNK